MSRLAFTAAVLPFVLAACSSGDADADGDGSLTGDEVAQEMASGPQVTMQPGQWQQSVSFTELDMPQAPQGVRDMVRQSMGATVTSDSCLTADQVESPDAEFFAGEGQGNCRYDSFDRSGNRLSLRMTCTEDGGTSSTMAMEGEFTPTAYTFDIDTTLQGGETGPMSMKGTVSGKRIGECTG